MQKKKGISLIVLVITIIVMIVLAGAIILSLNNSGIIGKANQAVSSTDLATVKELAQMAWAEAYASGIRHLETIKVDSKEEKGLKDRVYDALEANGVVLEDYFINVTTKGADVIKTVYETVDGVPIPVGFVASKATGENKKSTGLVIYEGTQEVTDANVEIAKRTRNQYVWVPINKLEFTTKFVRSKFGTTNREVSLKLRYGILGSWLRCINQ